MINITIHNLEQELKKKIYFYHFIIEKEFVIYQEIKKTILNFCKINNFLHTVYIIIQYNIDWEKIYFEYKQKNFFIKKKIIIVNIKNKVLDLYTIQKIHQITQHKNKNIAIIFELNNLNSNYKIPYLIKIFNTIDGIMILGKKLKTPEIKKWIKKKIINTNVNIKQKTIQILSNYYQNNLLILSKILEIIKIISINNDLKTKNIDEEIIENFIQFKITDFIHELLSKNTIQAIKILNHFKKKKYDKLLLIQKIQTYLIHFVKIQNNMPLNTKQYSSNNINKIFKKNNYHIRNKKLYKIINFLTKIEIKIKKYNTKLFWFNLKILITMF
ncbi:DNA polymerase III subunit delta [Buchnera aphidicola]|nr:DNA polymerase III subunit delta [Buchnera aphidicola (Stegophylla sp.)]